MHPRVRLKSEHQGVEYSSTPRRSLLIVRAQIVNNRSYGRIVYTLYWKSALRAIYNDGSLFDTLSMLPNAKSDRPSVNHYHYSQRFYSDKSLFDTLYFSVNYRQVHDISTIENYKDYHPFLNKEVAALLFTHSVILSVVFEFKEAINLDL